MSRLHKDSQGVVIEEGARVAYNMSGDVVPGVVVDTSCASHIKVKQTGNAYRTGHISRVRHGRSMLVLAGIAVENPKTGSTHWQRGNDAT